MLDFRIGLPLDYLLYLKTRCRQIVRHLGRLEEGEINTHFLAPPGVQMNRGVDQVKAKEAHAAWTDNSPMVVAPLYQFVARYVDNGVKRHVPSPSCFGCRQLRHVAL